MKKLLIKNLTKKMNSKKKMRLKYDRKKSIEYEIWKKKSIPNKKKIAIKTIRTKLERLKNHRGWN
jgi:hypothetical protein